MVAQKFLDCGLHLSAGHELNRGSHDRDLFLLFSLHGDISPSAHPILSGNDPRAGIPRASLFPPGTLHEARFSSDSHTLFCAFSRRLLACGAQPVRTGLRQT